MLVMLHVTLFFLSSPQLLSQMKKKQIIPRLTMHVLVEVHRVLHFVIPVVFTLICYLSTIVAVSVAVDLP